MRPITDDLTDAGREVLQNIAEHHVHVMNVTSEDGVLQWAWRPTGLRGEAVGDALSLVFRWVGPTREVVTASLELVLTLALTLTLTLT